MNKRALVGNLIAGLLVFFIGVTLVPQISYEISLIYCNDTNLSVSFNDTTINNDIKNNISYQEPKGSTGSFGGGGGDYSFGGYDGEVKHRPWNPKDVYNEVNDRCIGLTPLSRNLINLLPIIFALGVLGVAMMMSYTALRDVGIV